jgi:hypothetical protein
MSLVSSRRARGTFARTEALILHGGMKRAPVQVGPDWSVLRSRSISLRQKPSPTEPRCGSRRCGNCRSRYIVGLDRCPKGSRFDNMHATLRNELATS